MLNEAAPLSGTPDQNGFIFFPTIATDVSGSEHATLNESRFVAVSVEIFNVPWYSEWIGP
jgi:hypothetical protein